MITRVSKLRKHLVSLDIGQLNALVVFGAKSSTTSESTKELLDDIFAECDRNSLIKNFTDRLNLGEMQVDDISTKSTQKIQRNKRNIYQSSKSSFK